MRHIFLRSIIVLCIVSQMILFYPSFAFAQYDSYAECLADGNDDRACSDYIDNFYSVPPAGRGETKRPKQSTGDPLRDAALGALNLVVCGGGSLKERLGEAGEVAAIGLATEGVNTAIDWLTGPNGFLKSETAQKLAETLGTFAGIAGSTLPIVGPLIGGVLGNLLGGDTEKRVREEDARLKDSCLDSLARVTAQDILDTATRSTLRWVQNEFETGNPGFVTDIYGRFLEIADSETYRFLTSPDFVNATCYIFRDDVYAGTLSEHYRANETGTGFSLEIPTTAPGDAGDECALERAVGGVEQARRFVSGEFDAGGWLGWFQYSLSPTGNPRDAQYFLSQENQRRIKTAQELEDKEIGYGGGYIPMRQCTDGSQPIGPRICEDGSVPITITPASLVQDLVSGAALSETRRAEVSDELNETVEDFTFWTLNSIFKKDRGLLQSRVAEKDKRLDIVAEIDSLILDVRRLFAVEDEFTQKQRDLYSAVHGPGVITFDQLINNYEYTGPPLDICDITLPPERQNPGCISQNEADMLMAPDVPGDGISVEGLITQIEQCNLATVSQKTRAQSIRTLYSQVEDNNAVVTAAEDIGVRAIEYRGALVEDRLQDEQSTLGGATTTPGRLNVTLLKDNLPEYVDENGSASINQILRYINNALLLYRVKLVKKLQIIQGMDNIANSLKDDDVHNGVEYKSDAEKNSYLKRVFVSDLARITSADYIRGNPKLSDSKMIEIVFGLPEYSKVGGAHETDMRSISSYLEEKLRSAGVITNIRQDFIQMVEQIMDKDSYGGLFGSVLNIWSAFTFSPLSRTSLGFTALKSAFDQGNTASYVVNGKNPFEMDKLAEKSYEEINRKLSYLVQMFLENLTERDLYALGTGASAFSPERQLINSVFLEFRPNLKDPSELVDGAEVTMDRVLALREEFENIPGKHTRENIITIETNYENLVNTIISLYLETKDLQCSNLGGTIDISIPSAYSNGILWTNEGPIKGGSGPTLDGPAFVKIHWSMVGSLRNCTASRSGNNDTSLTDVTPGDVTSPRSWQGSIVGVNGDMWVGPMTASETFFISCVQTDGVNAAQDSISVTVNYTH